MSKRKQISRHALEALEEALVPPELHIPGRRQSKADRIYVQAWNECRVAMLARLAQMQGPLH